MREEMMLSQPGLADRQIAMPGGDMPGSAVCYQLEGYREEIESEELVEFEYSRPAFFMSCVREKDGTLHIVSRGGSYSARDGSAFVLDYRDTDGTFLQTVQAIIKEYGLAKRNGYYEQVHGLPDGLGDRVQALYASGERIYKFSNRGRTVSEAAADAIYEVFHAQAVRNGYDFTTEKSTEVVYDDATVEFLQGRWKGVHFGQEWAVEFDGNHVRLYRDGKLTDDTDYVIVDGMIRPDVLKAGITTPKDPYDYEEFSEVSALRKKNSIGLTVYFMKDGYSTADLILQK